MLDRLEPLPEIVCSPTLIDALGADVPAPQRQRLLATLREQIAIARAATARRGAELDALCAEAARRLHAGPDELTEPARMVLTEHKAVAERLAPRIEALEQKLAAPATLLDTGTRALFQSSVDAGKEHLALYGAVCERLLRRADERRSTPLGPLPARPVEGDVDYDAMTRETIARFPNILATLAE
jgi:hypothetical protein